MIAFITGSKLYEFPGFQKERVDSRFGQATVFRGESGGREILVLPRHGPNHRNLPHHINHRANLLGLHKAGATAVVSCTVCGIINPNWPLAAHIIGENLYFPENRLPDGSPCTIFDQAGEKGRGHLLVTNLFNRSLSRTIEAVWTGAGHAVSRGTYGHVNGPRFNSPIEICALARDGIDFVSQTCGPEVVLANELELPCALAAFGINHAGGAQLEATPPDALHANLARAKTAFLHLLKNLPSRVPELSFGNFIYRFD